jgi:hypothetical protein
MTGFATRTVGDVVAEMLMSRTTTSGSLLVIEGSDDIKFWKTRIAAYPTCQLIQGGSKATVIGAVIKAESLHIPGVLGVVDDDHDSLVGRSLPSANLIHTGMCDIETLLLNSDALDHVVAELGDGSKIAALQAKEGMSIRDILVARSLIFGQLR